MLIWIRRAAFSSFLLALCAHANAQSRSDLYSQFQQPTALAIEAAMDEWWMRGDAGSWNRHEGMLSGSVSKLDLKAPGVARRDYDKGVALLLRKNLDGAVEQLTRAITAYPSFVAAHNALGSAYLQLGRNEQARQEFAEAVSLDDHLPGSHLNLGKAQLALQDYAGAEGSIQKASALTPLDLRLLTALTYAQLLNHDYGGVIATTEQVHRKKHENAAIVHYFAAAAWQGQNDLSEMERELNTFLSEDPKSSLAAAASGMVSRIEDQRTHPPVPEATITYSAAEKDLRGQQVLQEFRQERQILEAESAPECESCSAPFSSDPIDFPAAAAPPMSGKPAGFDPATPVLRSSVDEVGIFFAATDHGKTVSDLSQREVGVRDDGKPPASVLSFLSESELPLRLGLVIDTSASITKEFSFEQSAAASFVRHVVTSKDDLAFVVGFSNSVLLMQELTNDETKIARGIHELIPGGGTALWDAVEFAAEKLAGRREERPVARILVVISDGDDNSSSASLKQAIESAQRSGVIVYAVSTREYAGEENGKVGDRALKSMAQGTGGTAVFPRSIGGLDRKLADLQQLIRSRYLISYRPAQFQRDGRYRAVDITAEKSGHRLRVYARRGYYANARTAE